MGKKTAAIPVLMYHHVNPRGKSITVSPSSFENQMRYLSEKGYHSLDTSELYSIMKGEQPVPDRAVMITFDDGWLDNWIFAFPILMKYRLKAVIFVITSLIAGQGLRRRSDEGSVPVLPDHKECEKMIAEGMSYKVMMSWDELKLMEESGLADIQSHTHTHSRWDILYPDAGTLFAALGQELMTSKKTIEDRLEKKCNALCWPWGKYGPDYVKAAVDSGYNMAFTTEKGTNTMRTDPFRIRRFVVGDIGITVFRKKLFIHSREWISRAYLKYFK
ncbi:MAG: polysaccharide deacetylase family protein [Nitrospirota bacterium]